MKTYVRFNNDEKKYNLQELKKIKIQHNTLHEIEICKIDWSYSEFCKIAEVYLIPDLIRIIYDYAFNKTSLKMALSEHNYKTEVYFLLDENSYNFFFQSEDNHDNIIIHITSCPVIYKYIVKHNKLNMFFANCTCLNPHFKYVMHGRLQNNKIYESIYNINFKYSMKNVVLMFKIFRCLAYEPKKN